MTIFVEVYVYILFSVFFLQRETLPVRLPIQKGIMFPVVKKVLIRIDLKSDSIGMLISISYDRIFWNVTSPRGYKTFFMLNSAEHDFFLLIKC